MISYLSVKVDPGRNLLLYSPVSKDGGNNGVPSIIFINLVDSDLNLHVPLVSGGIEG